MSNIEIIPAILEKNLSKLKQRLKQINPYFDKAQIDIGDGKFVTDEFGCLDKIEDLKTKLGLEIHLMVKDPWKKIEDLKNKEIKKITFHYESFLSIKKKTRPFAVNNLIKRIKALKFEVGIALNPVTSPDCVADYLERIDEILLLGVSPGKQGQKFQELVLGKINFIKNFREDIKIGIDGGVTDKNISLIRNAGVDRAYIGSFLWRNELEESIRVLSEALKITN